VCSSDLNVAGFYWLRSFWSPPMAALSVALVNLVLAGLLVSIATRLSAERELEPMAEMRNLAIEDLEVEVQELVEEVRDVATNVRRMARDPFGSVMPGLAVPVITAVLKSMRKGKNETK